VDWEERQLRLVVAAVIARAARSDGARRIELVDSARHVVARAHATRAQDPEGELLGIEALVDVLPGDKTAAFQALKSYFAINPSHRARFAKTNRLVVARPSRRSTLLGACRFSAAVASLSSLSHGSAR
jgi:hypothetical protein